MTFRPVGISRDSDGIVWKDSLKRGTIVCSLRIQSQNLGQ